MRFLLLCLILSVSTLAHGNGYVLQNSNLYSALDIHEISQKLLLFEFSELDLKQKGRVLQTPIDQIYFRQGFENEIAILKLDLRWDSSQSILKLSDKEFVCHSQTSRKRSFSLYIKGRGQKGFTNICNSFRPGSESSFSHLFRRLVPSAMAAESNCSGLNSKLKGISELRSQMGQSLVIQRLGTCLSDAFRGASGTVTGIADGFNDLLSKPRELWNELSRQAEAVLGFVTHLKDEVTSLSNAIADLNLDMIMSLACHFGGEVLASMGLSALGGAGLAKLSMVFAQATLKLKSMTSILSRLNRLSSNGRLDLAKEVLSCARP